MLWIALFVHTRRRGAQDFQLKTGKKGKLTLNEPVLGRQHFYAGQHHSSLQQAVVEAQDRIASSRYSELKAQSELREAVDGSDPAAVKKAREAIAAALKKVAEGENELAKKQEALGTNWAGRAIQSIGADKKVQWQLKADATEGYALWFGVDDGRLIEAVLAHSRLHIVPVEPDAKKVDALRRRFDRCGLYGTRVAVHPGDPLSFKPPTGSKTRSAAEWPLTAVAMARWSGHTTCTARTSPMPWLPATPQRQAPKRPRPPTR